MREGDEVIVVGDTHHGRDLNTIKDYVEACGYTWLEHDAGYMGWGHPQINFGMAHATGDYLVFNDDDDIFAPDALLHIRRAVKHLDPPRPVLFKFKADRFGGRTFWINKGRVEVGTIGGHCIVAPNDKERLGLWTDRYEGDFDFIVDTLSRYDIEPVWRPEVIALAR